MGSGLRQTLALLRGFRAAVFVLSFGAIVSGLWLQVWWLWTLGLLIGAEELLETSVVIAALRDGSRRDLTRVGWRPPRIRFWPV
jgi:hypothetical protein